jgi:hypothetical protein
MERLEERDWTWWTEWISGRTQAAIARDAGVDQSTVSRAIDRVRAVIPESDKEELVRRSVDMLLELQAGALDVWRQAPAPMVAGKDGDYVLDPETGAHVRDHSGRLAALKAAVGVNESVRRLMGLDAAQKLDMAVATGEARQAERLAEEAARRVAGDPGE